MKVKCPPPPLVAGLLLFTVPTSAFNQGSVSSVITLVNDENRREFLNALLITVVANPLHAKETSDHHSKHAISSIHDPRLRGYRSSLLPDWQGTSLRRLSLSEAYSECIGSDTFAMGKWPDPILRLPSSTVPPSTFQNEKSFEQLRFVAQCLRNTARKEGAVGLAAQQCGIGEHPSPISLLQSSRPPSSRSASHFDSCD